MANRNKLLISVAAAAALAYAQPQGKVAGPIAGYVFDGAARGVRPVLGVPGASIFGSSVPLGYEVASAAVSPHADSAVVTAADGSVHLVRLSAGQSTELPLNGLTLKPERIAFSPSGTAVALIGAGHAQIFNGLPDAASLATTMDLGSATAAQASIQSAPRGPGSAYGSMALSDDGTLLLVVANGRVRLLGAGGPASFDAAGRGAVVAFAAGTHDAVLGTKDGVTLIRGIDSTKRQQPLTLSTPLANAGGVAFSTDGKSVFLAGGAGVTAFDLATGASTAIACNCTATRLERMGDVYRLNDAGSGPLWLLDVSAAPRIVFVPADSSE